MPDKERIDKQITNDDIANFLDRIADLLEQQDEENEFRIAAYHNAAASVRKSKGSVAEMAMDGNNDRLRELPGISAGLSRVITSYVKSGESNLFNYLRSGLDPEELFAQVPGIGDTLARRIVEELDINTLEELEQAAHNGSLSQIEGFGQKRVDSVKASLAGILSRAVQHRTRQRIEGKQDQNQDQPDIETLLSVDNEYREKASAGELRKIAPKRFNPKGEAWLPVLHTKHGAWGFTAMYSNTARAHELGTTNDWVVIYFTRDKGEEDQVTVVTDNSGPMQGERVVRGREAETLRYYQEHSKNIP